MGNLKVLFVASEVNPFIKSGGLGDVAGSLPLALQELGADVRVCLPRYRNVDFNGYEPELVASFNVQLDWRKPHCDVYITKNTAVPTYFIESDQYFNRDTIYGHDDDFDRFAFFSRAVLTMLPEIDFCPDIIHLNDWQTGLCAVYLHDTFKKFKFYKNIKTVFTIHNLQYQGNFSPYVLPQVGLNNGYFTPDKLEHFGQTNYMKAGLAYADYLTTVSPTYAHEIQTSQYGYGLEGLLQSRNHQLHGILNGIDYNEYNPATSPYLHAHYNAHNLANKAEIKARTQSMLGLPVRADVPVFAIISRLVEQKGMDLLAGCLHDFAHHFDMQLIVLGTGHGHFENMLQNAAHNNPYKFSANITFNAELSHQIYGASDFFLMPSLFEPCGLGQLIALRYGSVPVVRRTGGLADTITPYNYAKQEGCGIVFEHYDVNGLKWAVNEAIELFKQPNHFSAAQKNGMMTDFSWGASAKKYLELYHSLL